MEFSIKQGSPEKLRSGCCVIGVFENGKLSEQGQQLDRAAGNRLSDLIAQGDMTGKNATTLMVPQMEGIGVERVLLVGLGKPAELSAKSYLEALKAMSRALQQTVSRDAAVCLQDIAVPECSEEWKIRHCILSISESAYRPDQLKSKPSTSGPLKKITLITAAKPGVIMQRAVTQASAIANGVNLCRELGDLPGNICTPTYLAARALALGKVHKTIKTTVLEESHMRKLGMGAFLSVTKGTEQPAKLISLEYQGAEKSQKPVVLVGKGITFDSGGVSLKPGAEMDEMKYDMSGAASVLGTIQAIAEMGLKLNVVGVIPSCENLPSGSATKPGDIVTSMSGQTIEVLNTDAEGRLILCDALTYSAKFKPDTVIDIATLTGACVIALGNVASGLYSNQDDLAQDLLAAANFTHDKAWQMPLWDDYQPQLESNFADMQNIGGRAGGSITAACFLARFTKAYRWAHLDIAGTAWKSGKEKGATGRPVPLLTQYLISRASQ